ncbi:ABC transporter ATP-binding protein [Streptomyces boninensis]|uniref:ABC transporter ATP-binding protein n=1 Tax=Streptomyces boninensis TaxID=2039455 RepID=UPI003B22195E
MTLPTEEDHPPTTRPPSTAPLLSASCLTRRYGALTAVDAVDLDLSAGARHAIIGPNGAGKSTLLNLIAGTDSADAGRIALAGDDITRTAPAQRSRLGIARSFQQPVAIGELTVLENVILAAWRHHRDHRRHHAAWRRPAQLRRLAASASSHLEAVGLSDVAGRPAATLSHGQRRLLDLAAALAAAPRLLLLDEPAAGLTDRDIARLLTVLAGLPEDVTVLLVEHHTDVVTEFADDITVLAAGRVLISAPTQEALRHPEVRDVYLDTTAADRGSR